ncbi:hypothetical protein AK812_SmicGene12181 [Symbiodinium microadriaticum]|uniref:Uncharacterized protein n=1 Tax=Symbiodinium microadriaticum TaxID=2951 RepID=A0A1Q9EBC8_SYMMI|nr:hypothetical protein AK812_SmicGene12181 [Symbiodinium microadriaticum]
MAILSYDVLVGVPQILRYPTWTLEDRGEPLPFPGAELREMALRENSALTLCSAGLPPGAAATSTASSSSRPSKRGPATWHDTLPAKRQAREQARREAEQAEKADALAKAKALLAKPLPHRRMAEPEKKARAEARRPVRACVVRKF